ncbi:glycosyltransferase [Methylocystis parvus OBBP]|nr:glycosyltransferase [Methylocystis parvus]WBK01991.1 glycosyltransferase [Methylocystis parvus OBBP]
MGFETRLVVFGRRRPSALLGHPGAEGALFLGLKGMSDLFGWPRIWNALQGFRPDVIVAVNQTPLIVSAAMHLLLSGRPKLACVFHTTEMQPFESRLQNAFKFAVRHADCLIYVGENQRKAWAARGVVARRESVIANGVDLRQFCGLGREEAKSRLGIAKGDLVIGHVGAFRVEKNQIELIEAIARVRGRGVAIKALLVGDGPTRSLVESRVRALGLGAEVIFAGEQYDVSPFVAACDIGALCSTIETFPLSALEFLASGVPMIASNVGGAPEIVRDGENGRLYPSGDIEGFACAVQDLAEMGRRKALASRARASVSHLSQDAMVARYRDLVRDLLVGCEAW